MLNLLDYHKCIAPCFPELRVAYTTALEDLLTSYPSDLPLQIFVDPLLVYAFPHCSNELSALLSTFPSVSFNSLTDVYDSNKYSEWTSANAQCNLNVVYLIGASISSLQMAMNHISTNFSSSLLPQTPKRRSVNGGRSSPSFALQFYPFQTMICRDYLENGISKHVFMSISNFTLGFLPIESKLLTLSMEYVRPWIAGETDEEIEEEVLGKVRAVSFFHEYYLLHKEDKIESITYSLYLLQREYGKFRKIQFKGKIAEQVCRGLIKQVAKDAKQHKSHHTDEKRWGTLILFDRIVDPITPLCTPITYEGLLYEYEDIENGILKYAPKRDEAVKSKERTENLSKLKAMNEKDTVYDQLRHRKMETIRELLQQNIIATKKEYDRLKEATVGKTKRKETDTAVAANRGNGPKEENKENLDDVSVATLTEIISHIPALQVKSQQLEDQTQVVTEVQEKSTQNEDFRQKWQTEQMILNQMDDKECLKAIETYIRRNPENVYEILRLACLLSLCSPTKETEEGRKHQRKLIRGIYRIYGKQHQRLLINLCRMGWIEDEGVSASSDKRIVELQYEKIREELDITNDKDTDGDVKENDSIDEMNISYVTGGYAPLLVRLMEYGIIQNTWKALAPILQTLSKDPSGEIIMKESKKRIKRTNGTTGTTATKEHEEQDKETVVVCFLGGVTPMEITALRAIEKKYHLAIYILSTGLITGNRLMESLDSME